LKDDEKAAATPYDSGMKWEWNSPQVWEREASNFEGNEQWSLAGGRAWARMMLEEVAAGRTVITGEEGETVFFTCAEPRETPFD
jgi:hypothetical protein